MDLTEQLRGMKVGSHAATITCIGAGEVLRAEDWGLYYGVQLALNLEIAEIEVESDSAVLINDVDLHPWGPLF
ncbi:hypothetical protein ACLB2K_018791 [Fragaria x ananassa]